MSENDFYIVATETDGLMRFNCDKRDCLFFDNKKKVCIAYMAKAEHRGVLTRTMSTFGIPYVALQKFLHSWKDCNIHTGFLKLDVAERLLKCH